MQPRGKVLYSWTTRADAAGELCIDVKRPAYLLGKRQVSCLKVPVE